MTAGLFRTADYGTLTYHGGALEVARQLAPGAPEPWIDLSTGVNPHAYPLPDLGPRSMVAVARERRAREARGCCGAALRCGRRKRRRGSRLAGAYPSAVAHIAAWSDRRVGADLWRFRSGLRRRGRSRGRSEAARGHGAPSTSRSWSIPTIRTVGSFRAPPSSIFIRASRGAEACSSSTRPSPISTREEKPRAIAAHRAARSSCARSARPTDWPGFASVSRSRRRTSSHPCGPPLARGPSAVRRLRSAPALADSDWLEATRARLGGDAARLDALLHGAGWRIIGGTRLFRLAAHADARAAFERLLVAGILTRPFADAPDWLRFGIPGDENAWEQARRGPAR